MDHFIFFTTPDHVIEQYFGPLSPEDDVIRYEEPFTLANCVVHMGVFPSISQARKNNWAGEIPRGYREWKIGKRKFWTFRPVLWENQFTHSSDLFYKGQYVESPRYKEEKPQMKLLPGVKYLDTLLDLPGKPAGEHPDAVPVVPLFKDHPEDAWYLTSTSPDERARLWTLFGIVCIIILFGFMH